MIDIDLVTDLLNKHNITNKALAEDIQLIINQVYLDGKFSGQSEWYAEQDKDGEWIAEFDFDTGEEIPPNTYGDIPYQTDLHSKLDVDKLQAKQIENSDMSSAILSMFDDEMECPPPNQALLEAYERYKEANINFDYKDLPPGSSIERDEDDK